MIQRNPDFNLEVTLEGAAGCFKNGQEVLVCFEKDGEAYAASLLTKHVKYLSCLRDIPFEDMADAKYYVKGEAQ